MERLRIVLSIGLFIISTINAQCYGSADGNCLKRKDFQYQLQGVRIDPFPLQRSGEVRRSPQNQNQEVHRTEEQESNFDSKVTGDTHLHSGHAVGFRPYAFAAPTIRDVRWPHARVHAVTTNVNPKISKATENVDPTVTSTVIKSEPTAKILDSLMSEMGAKLNVDDGPEIKLKSLTSSEDSEEFNTQDIVNEMMGTNLTGCTNEKEEKREKLEFEPKNDEFKDKTTITTTKSPLEKIKEELVLMNKVVAPPAPPFPPAAKPPPPPPPQSPKASVPKAIVTPQNKVTAKEDAEMKSLENEKGKNSSESSSSSGDADDKDEKSTEKLKKVTGEEKEKKKSETMEKAEKQTKEKMEQEEVAQEPPSNDEQITEKPKTHHKLKLVEVSEEDGGEAETPKSTMEKSEKKESEGKSKKSENESKEVKKKARRVINTTDSKDGEDWDYTDGVDKVERESEQVEGDVNSEGNQDNKKKDKNSKKERKHKKTDETEESDENSDKEKNTDEDEKKRDKVEESDNGDDNEETTVQEGEQSTVEEGTRKPNGRRIKVEKADNDDDNEEATVQEGEQDTVEESTRKPKGRRVKVAKSRDEDEEAVEEDGAQSTVEESTRNLKGRRIKIEMKNDDNEEDEEPSRKNQKKPQNRRTKVRNGDKKAELEGENAEETPKKSGTPADDEILEITEEGAKRLKKKKKEPAAEEEGGEEGEKEREGEEEEGAEKEAEESAAATRSTAEKKRKHHRKGESGEHEELEEFLEGRGNKGTKKTRKQKTHKKISEVEDIRSNPDVRAKLRDAPNVKYYYPPKVNLPLPSCFYNPTGYACCNVKLNNLIEETFATVKAMKTVNSCNINLMAKKLQEASQNEFEHPFETIVSLADFAQNVHFAGDLVCKVEIDGKFMLTYATPYHADMALNGTGGIGNYPGKRIKQPLNIHSLRI